VPTILRIGPFRFFFYSNEKDEPPHIHVRRDRALAKFWLQPVSLAKSTRFSAMELNVERRHIEDNVSLMIEAWNDHLNS
jgi:Domain of unknown function (DUF4160)